MPFALSIAVALSAVITAQAPNAASYAQPAPQVQNIQQYVETYFADEPIMVTIARCESHFRQFAKDGSVYRGKVTPKDVGVMQINEFYQGDAAAKLGFDIYTLEGNTAYAQYLYDKEGTKPWNSSSTCWLKAAKADALALASK